MSQGHQQGHQIFVYVLRSPALVARQPNVEKLERLCAAAAAPVRIDVTLVTSNEVSEITADLVKSVVDINTSAEVPEPFSSMLKPMHVNQLSNNLKHFTALRMATENAKTFPAASHVVLEDDVLFNDEAMSMLASTIDNAPSDADVVFLGLPSTKNGTPSSISFEPMKSVFKMLPCCDSYIIKAGAAARLAAAYLPVRFPTQVHISFLLEKLSLQVYICSPNVFMDGSKLGVFMSSIEQNNALVWNPQYNQLRAILGKKQALSAEEKKQVDDLIKSAFFKEHPDFRYLAATAHVLNGEYKEASEEFERAFDTYVSEKCVFGPDCQFMKDYVQVFRHLQAPPSP